MEYEHLIIVNEEALTEVFMPTRLLHREGQIRELERCLRPALKNRSVENIFLLGTSETGKTTIAKWILENYCKEISAYVNCWKHRTTYMVLTEIRSILQIPVHGREPTGELKKTRKSCNDGVNAPVKLALGTTVY